MASLKESYKKLGPIKFFGMVLIIAAYIIIGIWLGEESQFRTNYRFHCSGRGCFFIELWYSPALLKHGGGYEVAEFLYLWSLPAFAMTVISWTQWKKRGAWRFAFFENSAAQDKQTPP